MSKSRNNQKDRRLKISPILIVLLAAFGLAVILTASGFAFAATQETHDSFCASCHTQLESTFFQRSVDTQPVDLASAHKADNTRCIDCHSGKGVTGLFSFNCVTPIKWVGQSGQLISRYSLIVLISKGRKSSFRMLLATFNFCPGSSIRLTSSADMI